jgi:ComF family protein
MLRDLILKFKDRDCLKNTLGSLLHNAVVRHIMPEEFDVIVPVPLSKKKEFERGYNQSQLLAEVVGKNLSKPVVTKNLVRVRDTRPQFLLSREERLTNLKDAFGVKNPSEFKSKNVVIVDDISTTCTTFEECARQLKKAGARRIYCAALAKD